VWKLVMRLAPSCGHCLEVYLLILQSRRSCRLWNLSRMKQLQPPGKMYRNGTKVLITFQLHAELCPLSPRPLCWYPVLSGGLRDYNYSAWLSPPKYAPEIYKGIIIMMNLSETRHPNHQI
jgi:hypothetical protein